MSVSLLLSPWAPPNHRDHPMDAPGGAARISALDSCLLFLHLEELPSGLTIPRLLGNGDLVA